ncbi:MAG: SDR family NAD(P)-dependent oxidoreductase [Pseudomonadota bacterium]
MLSASDPKKHLVLTGGSSGIGRALLERVRPHHDVTLISRASPHLDKLRAVHPSLEIIETDLADLDAVRHAADQVIASHRSVDVLINNAAVQYTPAFIADDFDSASIEHEIAVNLAAPAVLTHRLLPTLCAGAGGTVLNVNSGLGLVPKTSSAVYCASKFGLNGLSLALANQLEGTGVRVVQAFLPLVDTGMTAGRGDGKLSADDAADRILAGLASGQANIDIGKVKLLRWIMRFSPTLARRIMRRG